MKKEKPVKPVKSVNQTMTTGARRGKLFLSGVMFVLCYLVLLSVILLMIICNDPGGWIEFITGHISEMVSLAVCVGLLTCIIYYYLYFENVIFLMGVKNILLTFAIFWLALILCYVMGRFVSIYSRPFAFLAIMCAIVFNRRRAILFNFVFSILMFVVDTFTNNFGDVGATVEVYYSLILTFAFGTFAVFITSRVKIRLRILLAGLVLALPSIAVVLLLRVPDLEAMGWQNYVVMGAFVLFGSFISPLFTICFLPFIERIFNVLTVFRLRELTSPEAPLLKRLRTEAPGTFHHSVVVAQLAESCAFALGEDAELARASAYYHDVGKLARPECFTENQTGYNIHNEISPELSVELIRSHATEGYRLLLSYHLPEVFADIAREHHGTLPIKYFYVKANKMSGGEANFDDFRYRGPTPRSKIAAIIMVCDASEAAIRSLGNPTQEQAEKVVRGIIEERLDLAQFDDCDITMRDLTTIKQTIVSSMTGVHHTRVKYPAMKFHREGKEEKQDEEK